MREIETDYLVVGAGASGMAFVDSLLDHSDAEAVMVDRRHRPGGHWLDAYPFVRIHQTSANYGVTSRPLGHDQIDASGFYERATGDEICDYYCRVLDEQFLPSGRVRFFGMSDYRGQDTSGHHFVSLLTGAETTVRVRRSFVDATYMESDIPSRHSVSFVVDDGVRLVTPNELVDLAESSDGFTVIGAGKTSMDACNWLMDQGVQPDDIRWIRPADIWTMDRAAIQPLDLVGASMQTQANWVEAAAEAEDGRDLALRVEAKGIFARIDPDVEPVIFRGAILSRTELESLRRIENVVRLGKVRRLGSDRVDMTDGDLPSGNQVYVDCTAAGVRPTVPRLPFDGGRITPQLVTFGIVPWSAAILGVVEALRQTDDEKNRLCPVVSFTGRTSDLHRMFHAAFTGIGARMLESDISTWNEACRLNPGRGAFDHMDDPRIPAAFASMGANLEPAMNNLARLVGTPSPSPV